MWAVRLGALLMTLGAIGGLGSQRLSAWVWDRLDLRPLPPKDPPAGLSSLSARSCRPCHPDQYEGWARSRMAQAMTDPVFLADWEEQDRVFVCRVCHSPLTEQQPTLVSGLRWFKPLIPIERPNPRFDPALAEEGVTCVACHLIDGAMVGPDGGIAPHPTRADPDFGSAERCVRCHQVPIPPLSRLSRPLADTHREWQEWQRITGRTETCVDCHMPERRHGWPGAWDPELLRSGLGVSAVRIGDRVEVTLENRAGHRLPSADPARALVVRAGGGEAVLARRVPLPKLKDEGDTTLLPGETRTVVLPAADEVEVLMMPVRLLGAAPDPTVEVPIARIEVP